MQVLEDQKRELDGAIQAEHVKAALLEDEASIGTFYKKYAGETMDTPETRDLLLEYFVDKIFVGPGELTIASWFFDHGAEVTFEELSDAKEMGEALTIEFSASPPEVEMAGIEPASVDDAPRLLRVQFVKNVS